MGLGNTTRNWYPQWTVRCLAVGFAADRDTAVEVALPGPYCGRMDLAFSGEMWFWRGPAPWHFVTVPEAESRDLAATAASVSYGWGMVPVTAWVGGTRWTTSLFPKDDRYVVPVRAGVRKAEGLEVGDVVAIRLAVEL
jgi:hypothetical protein